MDPSQASRYTCRRAFKTAQACAMNSTQAFSRLACRRRCSVKRSVQLRGKYVNVTITVAQGLRTRTE